MTVKRLFSAVLVLLLFTLSLGFSAVPARRERSVMEEFLDTVHAVVKDFPAIEDSAVQVRKLPDSIYAVTGGGEITVNEHFVSAPALLQHSVEHDVSLGFHPTLGHCTGVQFLAYHESAHLVDASENTASHNALSDRFGDGHQLHGVLSGYSFYGNGSPWVAGLINAPEALAEAFASVHCNGGNWAERELSNMLTN